MPFRRRHLRKGRLGLAPRAPAVQVATPGRPLWLVEGLKMVGTHEVPGRGNNPAIIRMARRAGFKGYTSDSVPWCSLAANYFLAAAGLPGTGSLLALSFESSRNLVKLPGVAVGAFMPMKRIGGGHIAVVVGRDRAGRVVCLGGNQSDAINLRSFPLSRARSFRWPRSAKLPHVYGFHNLPIVSSGGRAGRRER
jgi:uncharacterized protein (TIGR02594 family)